MDLKMIFTIFAMLIAFCCAKPLEAERTIGKELRIPDEEAALVLDGERQGPQDENDGEMMETANAMVFQPLFAYRRRTAQRRRVYRPASYAYRPYYGSYYGSSYYG